MCHGRFYRNNEVRAGWFPIGPGDDLIWVDADLIKEEETIVEQEIETEYDKENETDKEDK